MSTQLGSLAAQGAAIEMNLKREGEEEALILAVKLPRNKLNKLAPCLEVQVSFINIQGLASKVNTHLTDNPASQIPGTRKCPWIKTSQNISHRKWSISLRYICCSK